MEIHMREQKSDRPQLRIEMIQKRFALSADQIQFFSQAISAKLKALHPIKTAQSIMAYMPIQNEVDLQPFLLEMKEAGKRIILPRVEGETLVGVDFNGWQACRTSSFGILEPEGEPVQPDEIDIVLVPGLVYDAAGFRLGYGKGYYDRFLAKLPENAFKCGICYDFQVVDTVFPHAGDVPVHWIVTERSELAVDFHFF